MTGWNMNSLYWFSCGPVYICCCIINMIARAYIYVYIYIYVYTSYAYWARLMNKDIRRMQMSLIYTCGDFI